MKNLVKYLANIYESIKENIKELTAEPSTKGKLTTL